ncbi:glycosyltransferase family 4 protein [Phorcysia thermohydrogeniphila]|uniref:UDP-N-acetylmuramyl pentapeptide phosphotransferase/UDP-N-acetylglucosamine-1-phosphate transferase n=1 Tax=Phorcysia thermohydrogeniphila TaxID=936138 RepID=A0A4R1G9C3_9BACT|nr:MraY family glycosyltransferase [Phorcysia thermohydrogeniphila]TCK04464.1 UDP-N-acetylmuramyl pentapeptide phosphotransferase/UDP-N-acetylglucosamine-1-phosphate transferase [Phorcysia thermohydrogeniphila]
MEFGAYFLLSILISVSTILFTLRFSKKEEFLDTHIKAHAIHRVPVPRIGGLGIYLAVALFMVLKGYIKLFLLSTMVFMIGFIEDLKKDIPPKVRLAGLLLISYFSCFILGIDIKTLGFLELPYFLSLALTVVAIAGYTNAVNIVDGLNGLASGISLLFVLFLGMTYYEFGNISMFLLCIAIIGAIVGFLIFNFPNGKIFLGDGGAYFLGYICAILSIKLINLYPEVSPWFPLILGVYPVWEVLFSAYRRWKKGKPPFYPDKLHFHTLVYYMVTRSNPAASFIIVLWCFIFSVIAYFLKSCTYCLVIEFLIFVLNYSYFYRKLATSLRLS